MVTWDLLVQNWDATTGWTKAGSGTSDINPAGNLRQIPDNATHVTRTRDIGTLPATYTAEFRLKIEDFGDEGFLTHDFYDGVHRVNFQIYSTYIRNNDAGVNINIVTQEGTWYTWRLVIDSAGHHNYVYRDREYLGDLGAGLNFAPGDGTVYATAGNGAGNDFYSREDFLQIASGLHHWISDDEDLLGKFDVGQDTEDLPAEFVVLQWQEDLHARFEVGQGAVDLLGAFAVRQETSVDLPAFFEVDHILDLPAQFFVRNAGTANLLGMFDVGQNAVDLKATFDGQVSLNLPAQFEVGHDRANLKAQFMTRHSIPGPSIFGPILIEAATSDAVRFSFQRKSFRALGRIWVFYTDGTNIRVSSSKDGFTWKAPVTVRVGDDGEDFSVVEQNGYVHYAYASNELGGDLYYRRGLLAPDGSISWDPEQTAQTTSKYIRMPFIGIDSTDHPWIGYRYNLGSVSANYMYRFRSSSTNDGTWSTDVDLEPSGALYAIWAGSVSPVSGNRMHIFYGYDNGNLFTNLWDGSLGGITNLGRIRSRLGHSVTSVGDVVYIVYQKRTTNDLVFRKWDGSWGSEVIIQSAFPSIGPAICAIDANELYVFYAESSMIKYFRSEDAGATWTGPFDLKYVNGLPSYWDFSVFSNSGSPIIGVPVSEGTDAGIVIYDFDWAPSLHASFTVKQWQEDLQAGFTVAQWQEDLHARFEVGQGAANLPGEFVVRHEISEDLPAEFEVGQGAESLLAEFIVGQGTEDLLGELIVKNVDAEDLPAEFIVSQWQEDLHARFRVENVYDLRGTAGIAFYWQGADNPPESIVDFIVESPTGFWVAEFYDGPARLRYVFIPWTQFRETGIDGSRPDMSRVDGFIYIVHTDGRRRIDYIHAPIFGDLYAFFNVRHTATPRNLKTSFSIRRTAVPLNLKAEFTVRHEAGVDLAAGFTSQAVRDLPAEFVIRHPASADLSAEFTVA